MKTIHKIRRSNLLFFAAFLILPCLSTSAKADVLDLQFGVSGTTPVQTGFQLFAPTSSNGGSGDGTANFAPSTPGDSTSSIGVTFAGSATLAVYRDVKSGTYGDFYSSFIGASPSESLDLTGLDDSTYYEITLQSFDDLNGVTGVDASALITDTTPGGLGNHSSASFIQNEDPSGSLSANAAQIPAVIVFRSSSTGDADFSITDPTGGNSPRLNGFELTAAIPEPSTWALILLGTSVLIFVHRRRRGSN